MSKPTKRQEFITKDEIEYTKKQKITIHIAVYNTKRVKNGETEQTVFKKG